MCEDGGKSKGESEGKGEGGGEGKGEGEGEGEALATSLPPAAPGCRASPPGSLQPPRAMAAAEEEADAAWGQS